MQLVAQKVKVPNSAQSGRCSLSDMVLFLVLVLFCLGLGQLKLSTEKSSVPGPDDQILWCH